MRLNHTLGELNDNNFDEYGEWRYHITVMGTPSATEPWGWQLDGHHAIINYFVLGDQVVMTPFFAGSEPVIAHVRQVQGHDDSAGRAATRAWRSMKALDEAQRAKAILSFSKTGNDNLTEAWKDNVVLDYAGLRAAGADGRRSASSCSISSRCTSTTWTTGTRACKMDEVRQHLDRTWFAWIGKTDPGSVFYYRIHSPVILIEFDHQRPANLRHLATDPTLPNASTSTPSCARRTATTTARTCCGSTTCSIRTSAEPRPWPPTRGAEA